MVVANCQSRPPATLTEAAWNNTEIITGDIAIAGSLTLVQSLLRAGLLDRPQLFVHPVVLGKGARWFDKLDDSVERIRAWS